MPGVNFQALVASAGAITASFYSAGAGNGTGATTISVSASTPRPTSSRIIVALVTAEANVTLTSVSIDGTNGTLVNNTYTTPTPDLIACIAYRAVTTGTSMTVTATFSGAVTSARVQVLEVLGCTLTGVSTLNTGQTASGTGVTTSGPTDFAGGLEFDLIAGSALTIGGAVQNGTIIETVVVNSAYTHQSQYKLPTVLDAGATHGVASATSAAYAMASIGLDKVP